MSDASSTVESASAGPRSVVRAIITGIAGLAYAYLVWNAIAFIIEVAPVGIDGMAWFALIFAAVLPALVFAAAFAIARRRSIAVHVVVLVAGLGLSAAFWLDVLSYLLRGSLLA